MSTTLDVLLADLSRRGPDRSLAGMEAAVAGRIAAERKLTPIALWGWRSAAAALLLAAGLVVGGGAAANATPEPSLFSIRAALAPSTLLGEAP